jgi:hypothetical protein
MCLISQTVKLLPMKKKLVIDLRQINENVGAPVYLYQTEVFSGPLETENVQKSYAVPSYILHQ